MSVSDVSSGQSVPNPTAVQLSVPTESNAELPVELQNLKPGDTVRAIVIRKSNGETQLRIQSTNIPADIPKEIPHGEQVELKVTSPAPELRFELVQSQKNAHLNSETPVRLENILKALNVAKESLVSLQQALSQSPESSTQEAKDLSQLVKTLLDSPIHHESKLPDADTLTRVLSSPQSATRQDADALKELHTLLQRAGEKSIGPQTRELIKEIDSELQRLISQLPEKSVATLPANTSTDQASKNSQSALLKLADVLRNVTGRDPHPEQFTQEFSQFTARQVKKLEQLEQTARQLLSSKETLTPQAGLRETAQVLSELSTKLPAQPQKQIDAAVADAQKVIESLDSETVPPHEKSQNLLRIAQTLRSVEESFTGDGSKSSKSIPREVRLALRTLVRQAEIEATRQEFESQIPQSVVHRTVSPTEVEELPEVVRQRTENLLQSLTKSEHSSKELKSSLTQFVRDHVALQQSSEAGLAKALEAIEQQSDIKLFVSVLHRIEHAATDDTKPESKEFLNFVRQLRERLTELTRQEANPRELKQLLLENLKTLADKFSNEPLELNLEQILARPLRPSTELPIPLQNGFKAIDSQLRTILSFLDAQQSVQSGSELPEISEFLTRSITSLKQIVDFLKNQLSELDPSKQKEVSRLLDSLSKSIDQIEREPDPSTAKNLVRNALNSLKEISEDRLPARQTHVGTPTPETETSKNLNLPQGLRSMLQGMLIKTEAHSATQGLQSPSMQSAGKLLQTVAQASKDVSEILQRNPGEIAAAGKPALEALQHLQKQLPAQLQPHSALPPEKLPLNQLAHEIQKALDSLGQLPPEQHLLPDVQSLIQQLEATAKSVQSFQAQTTPKQTALPPLLQEVLNAVRSVLDGKAESLPQLQHLLSQFEQNLGEARTPLEHQMLEFVRELKREFENKPAQEISKAAVERAYQKIKEELNPEHLKSRDLQSLQSQSNTLKMAENMIRGQEALQRMSPLMQALGEPAFILFPQIIHGFLSQLEVSFYPPVHNESETPDQKKNTGGAFQKIHFSSSLPSLGSIEGVLRYRPKEVLLQLTVEKSSLATFVEGKLELLRTRLKEHGYTRVEANIRAGTPANARPGWVNSIARGDSIVA